MNEDLELPLIRATQRAARNKSLGLGGTLVSLASGIIVWQAQMHRAEAEASALRSDNVALMAKLDHIEDEIVSVRERVTKLEVKVDERTTRPMGKP